MAVSSAAYLCGQAGGALNNEYARSPERLALYRGERLRLAASVLMLAADFDSSALFTLGAMWGHGCEEHSVGHEPT